MLVCVSGVAATAGRMSLVYFFINYTNKQQNCQIILLNKNVVDLFTDIAEQEPV